MITIKKEKVSYLVFYREFYKNFLKIKEGKDSVILASLFIHLTFESLITYTIRLVIDIIFKDKKPNIWKLWYDIFETESLNKKLDFFRLAILQEDNEIFGEIKILQNFINNRLMPLRNKIVHGHAISETVSDNGQISRSRLLELLTKENIENLYKEFWQELDIFLNLFDKIDVPLGINLSSTFIPNDIIEGTKSNLKRIEQELEEKL